MKFTDAQARFLAWLTDQAPSTGRFYAFRGCLRDLGAYLKSRGVEDLESVTPLLLEEYKSRLQKKTIVSTGKPLSTSTVVAYIFSVRKLFSKAVEWGWLSSSPAASLFNSLPQRQLLRSFLSHQEMEKVLARPDVALPIGLRDRFILELMYSTGIRVCELLDLNIEDVNLDQNHLHIKPSIGGRERSLPLTGATRDFMNRYVKEIRPAWVRSLKRGGLPRRSNALLYGPTHGPMSESLLAKLVGGYVRAVRPGVPNPSLAIRYACAVRLLKGGTPVAELHTLFGHIKKIQTEAYPRVLAGIQSKQR